MLDLNILEQKLDAALAQETPESLSEWLSNKRKTNDFDCFSKGDMVPKKRIQGNFIISSLGNPYKFEDTFEDVSDMSKPDFSLAA